MDQKWYVLRSKPRKEDVVWRQVNSHGFESYYPRLRAHHVNPRSKKYKPYFPGYLFVKINLVESGASIFKWMPHTYGLVSFGGEPSYVPEYLISEIRKRAKEINDAGGEEIVGLETGDRVKIDEGPFDGYEAIFDAYIPGKERVRVLLKFLGDQRYVNVELSSSQVRKPR